MRAILMVLVLTAACGDNIESTPDAAARTCMPDAGADDCCRLYPDVAAVAQCVQLPAGTCGVVDCALDCDGNYAKINVCGPAK